MQFRLYATCILFLFSGLINAQVNLFRHDGIHIAGASQVITRGTKLKLDRSVLTSLFGSKPGELRLAIPIENETIILQLKKAQLFAKNFQVIVSETLETYAYTPGYYLQGTVEGETSSMAAISIFENFAGGVISYKGDDYNLLIANNTNDYLTDDYLLYGDKNNLAERPKCFMQQDGNPVVSNTIQNRPAAVGCPVDLYFEAAYRMFVNQGTVQNVMNFMTILFNAEQTLYGNENILFQIREIKVWNTPDPEDALTGTNAVLNAFSSRMGTTGFNGDLAHYVTFAGLGGGVAWLDVLCSSSYSRTAVSGSMSANYSPYPNYSFTVNVITHENGHNVGSPHTHSCSWPGGAIDNCAPTQGGCPPGPSPGPGGGTIMSYCHQGVGINFANGFGPLPGNLIRTKVVDASIPSCLCSCDELALDVTKQDIGCGNPVGSATVVLTGGTGPFTYEWSNGATTASVTGLAAGTYYVTVTGTGLNCTVVKGFKILTAGNVTTVSLAPVATSVTRCINDPYTISATVIPGGTYTYQWFKNTVAIPGANSINLIVNSAVAGTASYYLVATGGTCIGQSPTINVTFQAVAVPVITANGPTAICENSSVQLSVPAAPGFSTEWRLNGGAIPGATGLTYTANGPGIYTVRRFSATSAACTALSAPVTITIKPKPNATITTNSLSFCAGGESIITHVTASGETYKWYRSNVLIAGETANTISVTTPGVYKLEVLGANGCKNTSEPIAITVNPLPDSALSPATSVTLCDGGTLTLRAAELTGAIYTWYEAGQQVGMGTANTLNVTQSGAYSVRIKNAATGCTSSSELTQVVITPPPVIFAGNDTVLSSGQPYRLNVREVTSLGIVNYEWTPSTGLNDPFISNPTTILQQEQEYTVKGTHPSGCVATDKVLIKVFKGPAFYIPSAFSPNGDNTNDLLQCMAVGLKSFKYFDVYNRFGQKVFHTTNPSTGWDGTWKGKKLDIGTYIFIAEGVDFNGKAIVSKGTVTMIL